MDNRYMDEYESVILKPDKRQTSRKLVVELKRDRLCKDCRQLFPHYMLDFDHVKGTKVGNIYDLARAGDIPKLLLEVAKCELVCANCHRHRTYMRTAGVDRPSKTS